MFSTIDDEHLIEQVRQHPVLFDLANPKYLDAKYKHEIWEKIATELGKEGEWEKIKCFGCFLCAMCMNHIELCPIFGEDIVPLGFLRKFLQKFIR